MTLWMTPTQKEVFVFEFPAEMTAANRQFDRFLSFLYKIALNTKGFLMLAQCVTFVLDFYFVFPLFCIIFCSFIKDVNYCNVENLNIFAFYGFFYGFHENILDNWSWKCSINGWKWSVLISFYYLWRIGYNF